MLKLGIVKHLCFEVFVTVPCGALSWTDLQQASQSGPGP